MMTWSDLIATDWAAILVAEGTTRVYNFLPLVHVKGLACQTMQNPSSPLHDMTQGIMYSMAVTVMHPL